MTTAISCFLRRILFKAVKAARFDEWSGGSYRVTTILYVMIRPSHVLGEEMFLMIRLDRTSRPASADAQVGIGYNGQLDLLRPRRAQLLRDRKSTRLNSSHQIISYAVFCLKKKKNSISHLSIVLQ